MPSTDPFINCNQCSKPIRKSNMSKHMHAKHSNNYILKKVNHKQFCALCGKKVSTQNLRRHIKRFHKDLKQLSLKQIRSNSQGKKSLKTSSQQTIPKTIEMKSKSGETFLFNLHEDNQLFGNMYNSHSLLTVKPLTKDNDLDSTSGEIKCAVSRGKSELIQQISTKLMYKKEFQESIKQRNEWLKKAKEQKVKRREMIFNNI